jgi:hypothetical protein
MKEVGISYRFIPGSAFPASRAWEKGNSETKRR